MAHPIVEAGAKAFHALEHVDMPSWLDVPVAERADYSELARVTILAALRAMREPPINVEDAMFLEDGGGEAMWRAGIDALIKEIEG